jgi:two-component system phosphate regulon sensor histidine kinase PhoR
MLFSLLDNAFKYSDGPADILISTVNTGNNIVLSIADKGIGLDAETKQLVFERFFRAATGDLHNVKGYGIGLSYVKSVIEAHDGSVRVESKPGEGSQFILTLPCYRDGS